MLAQIKAKKGGNLAGAKPKSNIPQMPAALSNFNQDPLSLGPKPLVKPQAEKQGNWLGSEEKDAASAKAKEFLDQAKAMGFSDN